MVTVTTKKNLNVVYNVINNAKFIPIAFGHIIDWIT